MKTPEELAKEYLDKIADSHSVKAACEKAFKAGYKAGQGRTDHELMKAYLDMKYNESFGMKLAVFVNGLRKGLKRIKDYENT